MKLYTSYFWMYEHGKLPINIFPISVARTQPNGLKLFKIRQFMPSQQIWDSYRKPLKGSPEEQFYIDSFRAQLAPKSPEIAWNYIEQHSGGRDAVLLCYENPSKFCHRHIIAEWFNNAGYNVTEYDDNEQFDIDQISFFDPFVINNTRK